MTSSRRLRSALLVTTALGASLLVGPALPALAVPVDPEPSSVQPECIVNKKTKYLVGGGIWWGYAYPGDKYYPDWRDDTYYHGDFRPDGNRLMEILLTDADCPFEPPPGP